MEKGVEPQSNQVVENFKLFKLILIRAEISHIMKNRPKIGDINKSDETDIIEANCPKIKTSKK